MDDTPLKEGVEHLQAAAREAIAAVRAMLDVAEQLVDDPDAVRSFVGELTAVLAAAGRAAMGARPTSGGDDEGSSGGVERITVS